MNNWRQILSWKPIQPKYTGWLCKNNRGEIGVVCFVTDYAYREVHGEDTPENERQRVVAWAANWSSPKDRDAAVKQYQALPNTLVRNLYLQFYDTKDLTPIEFIGVRHFEFAPDFNDSWDTSYHKLNTDL
jgi:hypothetical protein